MRTDCENKRKATGYPDAKQMLLYLLLTGMEGAGNSLKHVTEMKKGKTKI